MAKKFPYHKTSNRKYIELEEKSKRQEVFINLQRQRISKLNSRIRELEEFIENYINEKD